jgi:putative membrane protein
VIRNFRDHAANERTFLAWVRTAIAVMAFEFLIERFDLMLKAAGMVSGAAATPAPEHELANIAGTSTIVLGTLLFVLATFRFLRTSTMIDSEEQRPVPGSRMDVVLGGLLSVMGIALLVYLSHLLTAA